MLNAPTMRTLINSYKTRANGNMKDTIGRRIDNLLWAQGNLDDLGRPYMQAELISWLSGETVAPNGKRYNVRSSNQSTISRIINDEMRNPPIETLVAIAEIFNRSLDWLLTGEERVESKVEAFITTEAGKIGALVDDMDKDQRELILAICQQFARLDKLAKHAYDEVAAVNSKAAETDYKLKELQRDLDAIKRQIVESDQQLLEAQKELASVWTSYIEHVPENQRRAKTKLIELAEQSAKRS